MRARTTVEAQARLSAKVMQEKGEREAAHIPGLQQVSGMAAKWGSLASCGKEFKNKLK